MFCALAIVMIMCLSTTAFAATVEAPGDYTADVTGSYVAGNETIVGATGIVGPLLGGAFITPASSHWIFIAGAVLVFAALAGQQLMLARARCFK